VAFGAVLMNSQNGLQIRANLIAQERTKKESDSQDKAVLITRSNQTMGLRATVLAASAKPVGRSEHAAPLLGHVRDIAICLLPSELVWRRPP
jgi:hypothetical protein